MTSRTFSKATRAEVMARVQEDPKVWGNVKAGDEVRIAGLKGKWRFQSVREVDGEVQWVNVYGPVNSARGGLRSFVPGRVKVK